MPDVLRHVPAAASVPSVTVASTTLPAQLTLAPISNLQTAATIVVTGGEGTLTYSWSSASGGTFGDAAALNSSYTPTGGGVHTLVLVVTDANGATAIITLSLTVGIKDTESGGHWIEDWSTDGLTHNFLTEGATVTHDGVLITLADTATAPTEAAFTAGALAIDTVDGFVWVEISAAYSVSSHVRWGMAIDAGLLTADNDAVEILRVQAPLYFFARAIRTAGAQNVTVLRDGTPDEQATAGGGQVRVLELEHHGQSFRTLYSEAAYSGWVAPSAMSKHNDVDSGWYTSRDVPPSATADPYDSTGKVLYEVNGGNGRRYTLPRLYRLVKA